MTRDGGGSADELSMVIEDIREIARDDIGGATDHAEDSKGVFSSVGVGVGDFSSVPMAREFGLQHKAAHEVFRDTITGVLTDLEEFRTRLLACADGHEATDDSVRAHLQRMSKRYQEHELHSKRNYDHSRREQGSALGPAGATSQDGGSDHSSHDSSGHSSGPSHHSQQDPSFR